MGDRDVPCRCSDAAIERYRAKLGGPLADRIDIILHVARPDPDLVIEGAEGLTTDVLRDQVEKGRAFCAWRESRIADTDECGCSASLDAEVRSFGLDAAGRETLLEFSKRSHLTGRGVVGLCRISRTIADMAESEFIQAAHVLEAAQYQGRYGDGGV